MDVVSIILSSAAVGAIVAAAIAAVINGRYNLKIKAMELRAQDIVGLGRAWRS